MLKYFNLGIVLCIIGCATVPTIVPQPLIDARSALGKAEEAKADILEPEGYSLALKLLKRAEKAFEEDQSTATISEIAFEAKAYAEIAEAKAGCKQAEQVYSNLQQSLITQQTMLMALSKQGEILEATKARLKKAEEDKSIIAAQVALASQKAEAEAELRAKAEREAKMLKQAQKIKDAKVSMESRGLVINLSGKVLFDTGSASLQVGAKSQLSQVAKMLKEFPEYVVTVEGHTDSTGDKLMNEKLSQTRAESVVKYLQEQEVPLLRLKATGKGFASPIASNKTPEGRQLNRRVEIILQKGTEDKNQSEFSRE